jgi:PAS domain S-box-containing protein
VTSEGDLLEESAEELFEDAPCGYLMTRPDGTIVRVNRTFEQLTGFGRSELVGRRRLQDLLTAGGRIYHETHYAPLLAMQDAVSEIALDLVRADGSRLPALVNAVVRRDAQGQPALVRTMVFDATDRRRYEGELLAARKRERDTALELQRSLLAGDLPRTDAIRVDVAYRPAVRGLEVGGDWYDAFWLEAPHTVGLAVGDVVGRGIGAAATMGQLRSAIRALAAAGRGPGALLDDLDQYARRHDVGQMATLAYGHLDLRTLELRYACAGHPPPALLEPGGTARLLTEGRSLPIDAFGASAPRREAGVRLVPGSTVVLYTDGLIERRDRPMDVGLDTMLAALREVESAPDVAAAAVRELTDPGDEPDDVCVLALRLG